MNFWTTQTPWISEDKGKMFSNINALIFPLKVSLKKVRIFCITKVPFTFVHIFTNEFFFAIEFIIIVISSLLEARSTNVWIGCVPYSLIASLLICEYISLNRTIFCFFYQVSHEVVAVLSTDKTRIVSFEVGENQIEVFSSEVVH